jgi:hypothetical protein
MKKTIALAGWMFLSLIISAQGSTPLGERQPRNFVLFFEILDYTKDIGDAVSFFFTRVLDPGDQLIIYTPARVYGYSKSTLSQPKRDLVIAMQDHLRADTAACSSNYKIIMNDMKIQTRDIENSETGSADGQAGLKSSLTMYRQNLANLQSLRKVNETLLSQIINMYKTQQGKNHMVMIYQAEFRPIPNKDTLNSLMSIPIISFEVSELFMGENQKPTLNAGEFIDAFKEIPVTLHFLYIKSKDASLGRDFKEHSSDMYSVFSQMAKATGGIVETTASPEAALKTLVQALNASVK